MIHPKIQRRRAGVFIQSQERAGDPLGILKAIRDGAPIPIPVSLRERFERGDFDRTEQVIK